MRQKIEIKVYLPYLMVGELEGYKRNGMRSKFVEDAIRSRLDAEEAFSYSDITSQRLMALLINRFPDDVVLQTILVKRIEELNE
jgi:metal-responsive CopG/Arc/MetJ family transcriptional regulator